MSGADVVIAGAGPTGLLLAAELAMRGVRVVVLERNLARPDFVRAFNLNARSLEILDRRGIVDRFLAEGPKVPFTHFAALDAPLDLAGLDTDHPYVLGIPQTRTEALLEAHALEQGADVRWGHTITDVGQDDDGVTIQLEVATDASPADASRTLHARWLVGCDGGRSTVRKRAGIGFPGTEVTGASECLNGSLVYVPALLAMAIVGGLMAERKHPAAPYILWAALIFSISVAFRSLDLALCDAYQFQGRKIGTHFVWHLLNGLALFLLLRASLEVGPSGEARAIAVRRVEQEILPPLREAPRDEGR